MPIHPPQSRPPHSLALLPANLRRHSPRRLWPGLLLGLLAVGFLLLSALAFMGVAGLLIGLRSAPSVQIPRASLPSATAPPATVVMVVPGPSVPESAMLPMSASPMPAPAELIVLAAAPLPDLAPTPKSTPEPTSAPAPPVEAAVAPPASPVPEPVPTLERQEEKVITYGDLFRSVGEQAGIDWRLLAALAYRESRMDPVALGRDGDMGLMQILPATWDEFAPQVAATSPFNPVENAQVAGVYLAYLQDFLLGLGTNDLRWVLVAYNWGPERVRSLLADGGKWEDVPAPQQRYVADILYAAFGE
jgi:soluble lytic murein transglycosylase-like protein